MKETKLIQTSHPIDLALIEQWQQSGRRTVRARSPKRKPLNPAEIPGDIL